MQWYWWVLIIGAILTFFIFSLKGVDKEMQPVFDSAHQLIGGIEKCTTFEQWQKYHFEVQKFEIRHPRFLGCITALNHALLLKAQKLAKK